MKVKVLMLLKTFVLLVLMLRTASGANLDEVSIDEDASHSFESISISNGTSLVVRTSLYSELCFRKSDTASNRPTPVGSSFVVNLGETLYFRAPWVRRDSKLTYFQPSESVRNVLPAEFRTASNLILLRKRGVDYFISPNLQKAFSTNDNSVSYFKFPYRSIWGSLNEYRQWVGGRDERSRRTVVDGRAQCEKSFGESLYRRLMAMPLLSDLTSARYEGGTNVYIVVEGELTNGIPRQVGHVLVRIDGVHPQRRVQCARFEYSENGRNIFRYCYDSVGRLRWFVGERAVLHDNGKTELADPWILEFDSAGALVRSLDPGPNPLLVITDRTFYFSGEGTRIQKIIDDAFRVTKDML